MKINHPHSIQPITAARTDWGKLNDEYEKSGLTQKIFCQRQNIPFNQFSYQRVQLQKENCPQKKLASVIVNGDDATTTFFPSKSTNLHEGFILEWPSGKRLIVPAHANAETLSLILTVLGRIECSR